MTFQLPPPRSGFQACFRVRVTSQNSPSCSYRRSVIWPPRGDIDTCAPFYPDPNAAEQANLRPRRRDTG